MGQHRQDQPGHSSGRRASVREAAELLGTTVDAIRKRVQRRTIPYEKGPDGRVWILLDSVQDATGHRQDTDRTQSDSAALMSEMHARIQFLEDELQRKDAILLNMTEAMKALSPPSEAQEAPPDERDSPGTVEEEPERAEPRPDARGAQEGVRRPWWRRMFGA